MPVIVRSVPVSIVPAALSVKEPVSVWATFRTRQVAPPVVEKVDVRAAELASVWKLSPSKTVTPFAVTAELVNSTVLPALPRSWMSLGLPGALKAAGPKRIVAPPLGIRMSRPAAPRLTVPASVSVVAPSAPISAELPSGGGRDGRVDGGAALEVQALVQLRAAGGDESDEQGQRAAGHVGDGAVDVDPAEVLLQERRAGAERQAADLELDGVCARRESPGASPRVTP